MRFGQPELKLEARDKSVAFGTGGGVPAGAIFLNGKPLTLNGNYITLQAG